MVIIPITSRTGENRIFKNPFIKQIPFFCKHNLPTLNPPQITSFLLLSPIYRSSQVFNTNGIDIKITLQSHSQRD